MKIRGFLIVLLLAMVIVFAVYLSKVGDKSMIQMEVDQYKQMKTDLTKVSLDLLAKEITGFVVSQGEAPAELKDLQKGRPLTTGLLDGWGKAIKYERLSESGFRLTSAGPDGNFDTPDDLSREY